MHIETHMCTNMTSHKRVEMKMTVEGTEDVLVKVENIWLSYGSGSWRYMYVGMFISW